MSKRLALSHTCRLGLALLLLWTGVVKLIDLSAFSTAITYYHLVPASIVPLLSVAIPASEVAIALILLARPQSWWPPLAAGCLSVSFLCTNISAIFRGLDISCGCFGSTSGKVGLISLVINLAMALASYYLASQVKGPRTALKAFSIFTAILVLATSTLIMLAPGELTYKPVTPIKPPSTLNDRELTPPPNVAKQAPVAIAPVPPTVAVTFNPPMLELGEVELGNYKRETVLVSNHTDHPIRVTAIGLGCHCMKVWLPNATLPANSTSEMIVKYTAGPKTGLFKLGIGLKTKELPEPLVYLTTVSVPKNKR